MKNWRRWVLVIMAVLLLPGCVLLLTACNNSLGATDVYMVDMVKTGSNGNVDIYTITYSNGKTSEFTVTNGVNGQDGAPGLNGKDGTDVSFADVFAAFQKENPDADLTEFLQAYLTLEVATDNTNAINKALGSCLKVYADFVEYGSRSLFGSKEYYISHGAGSAVIYRMDADVTYIVTNYHVIYDNANSNYSGRHADIIHGYLYGSESTPQLLQNDFLYQSGDKTVKVTGGYDYGTQAITLTYLGGSATHDIAVLVAATPDILRINPQAKPVTLADQYVVGETAIAIGNPEDEGISVTQGIISVDNEYILLDIDGERRYHRSIRIDTALYSGNSGGGLFNKQGQLIGITNAGDNQDQNVNFAVPLTTVRGVADSLIADGAALRVLKIGVSVVSSGSRYVYNSQTGTGKIYEDTYIAEIVENSLAAQWGLAAEQILMGIEINGTLHEFHRYFELGDWLLTVRADDVIRLQYRESATATTTQWTPSYTVVAGALQLVP